MRTAESAVETAARRQLTDALGWAGEEDVRRWLEREGFYVVPMARIEDGGAPLASGPQDAYVLPDLQILRAGQLRWVEVATKTRAAYYERAGIFQHGKMLRQWEDYLRIERESGVPGWLCIYELTPRRLILLQSFERLLPFTQRYDGSNMPGGKPHVFWPRDAFNWYQGPREHVAVPLPPTSKRARDHGHGPAPMIQQLALPLFSRSTAP